MPTSPSDESENESVYVCESVDKDKGSEVVDKPVYAGAPTVEDVAAYCQESGYTIDPAAFVRWNEARGWMNGKNTLPWTGKGGSEMVLQGKRHRLFGDGDSGKCLFGCARQGKGGTKWLILQLKNQARFGNRRLCG